MGSRSRYAAIASSALEEGLELFRRLIAANVELTAEFVGSREEFFAAANALGGVSLEERLRDRRHFEWFLFERNSKVCNGLPVDALLEPWLESAGEELAESRATYTESMTGILEIQSLDGSGVAETRDLAGLTRVRLAPPVSESPLQVGDLVVGRLHPVGNGLHAISPAGGFFRNRELVKALIRDLDRLRAERVHAVMRLSQMELERMFWDTRAATPVVQDPDSKVPQTDPVGELERFLRKGGVAPEIIQAWCRALARCPFDPKALISGVDDVVAQVLEQLAFQTGVDLGRARDLLLRAWPILTAAPEPETAEESPQQVDRQHVLESLAEFDRDRRAGIDVDASFSELARRLGLDEDESEEESGAPDFPGVVSAVIEEFLWETELQHGADQRKAHEGLRIFGEHAHKVGVFENLGQRDVLSFATFWIPESRRVSSPGDAERLIQALSAFCEWAEQAQGMQWLDGGLGDQLRGLEQSLPRAVAANVMLQGSEDTTGELFEYQGRTTEGRATIEDHQGEVREVAIDEALLRVLESGDLFRGHTRDDGLFVVSCCYPPEAAGLRQT